MTDQPIFRLFQELGRSEEDLVTLGYFNATTEWKQQPIQAKYADILAQTYTEKQLNVYLMPNRATTDLVAARGTAEDVTELSALWADLDVKEGGMPDEASAYRVIEALSALVNSKPVAIVSSGHGVQPYWAVEEGSISQLNRKFMKGLLQRWGYLVKRICALEGGKADSVYDLPRMLRAPGTVNFKDPSNLIATTVDFPEWNHPISVQEIDDVLTAYGIGPETVADTETLVLVPPDEWEPADRDCAWVQSIAHAINTGQPGPRHPWLLAQAIRIEVAARNGCLTEDTYGELVQLLEAKFINLLATGSEPRTAAPGEVNIAFRWARAQVSTFSDVRMADNLNYHSHTTALYAVPDLPKESTPSSSGSATPPPTDGATALKVEPRPVTLGDENFVYTDTANAARLVDKAAGAYIFTPGLGWHVWQDGRYQKDDASSITQLAIVSAKEFAHVNVGTKDALKWAQASLSSTYLNAAIKLAATNPKLIVPTKHLDSVPLELCTPGGIVQLDRGEIRPAVPGKDLNTRQTAVTPDVGAFPKFQMFLEQSLPDPEMRRYIQLLMGVALIGEIRWHILPVFSGPGANGKSALLDICGGVLGDYSAIMPENFLLDSAKLEHSTEIARLRGVRLAIASETRPDGKFNESRVKMLTGEKTLSARTMRSDFIDFPASHTIFVALNHPPQVRNGGESFWRRLRKIDFNHIVPENRRDTLLATKIIDWEGPQVLNWMIEGARDVLDGGLVEPAEVRHSTNQYRGEEDHIESFLDACTAPSPESTFTNVALYGTYVHWCKRNGEEALNSTVLLREIRQRLPLVPLKIGRDRGYRGMMVHEDYEPSGERKG